MNSEISDKKVLLQEEAVKLSRKHDNLLLSWATGTSKTLAAIKAYDSYLRTSLTFGTKNLACYVVLKETNHEDNWKAEFKKWGYEHLLPTIEFFCYASLKNYQNTKTGMIILDEVHALSEVRDEHLNTIKCEKIISLSATVPSHVKQRLKAYKPGFYEWHISLQKAIAEGFLPEPDMFILRIPLDNTEKKHLYIKNKKDKGELVTAREYYKRLERSINWWEQQYYQGGEGWKENRWMMAALKRKKMMAYLKTDAAKEMLKHLEKDRLICFTGSIEQCNELGSQEAIHSKISAPKRKALISQFNEREIDKLFAVGMLRESMNLEAINSALLVQLDNSKGSGEQMIGRALRSISPRVYFIVLKDTQDEIYLDKVLKGIDKKYIHEFTLPESKESVTL